MLQLEALSVRIGNVQVCQNLSLSILPGQRWALLGVNGVGKSTLMLTLAGLRSPQAGRVLLDGVPLSDVPPRQRARRIGLMSQDDEFAQETRVIDAVMLGRLPHRPWWAGPGVEDQALAEAALARVGLGAEFATRLALTLSGGERRRVALASLLAQDSELLILDEPTNHLDLHQQVALLDLLAGLAGHTLLMSLHDINLATRFCTHALLMFGDSQCCGGPIGEMLNADVLTQLYRHPIRAHASAEGTLYVPI